MLMRQVAAPDKFTLETELGDAFPMWEAILCRIDAVYGPLSPYWTPSKVAFGKVCVLCNGKRNLVYLTPERGSILATLALGEKACEAAFQSGLPDEAKTNIANSKKYVEGRSVRMNVNDTDALSVLEQLLVFKTRSS